MGSSLPEAGTVIGDKYVVERLLGQGGMGAVFVVQHRLTHKRLALKLLLPEISDQGGAADRFLREARAAGSVQHRHVVDIFDIGHDQNGLFMVMELLEGRPLSEMLQDESATLQEVLVVASRAMQGVAEAHACGVIHRDLKPDNIFVCRGVSGRLDDPRVLDFGISKSQADPNLTLSGMVLGTPYYMSLEQINGQRDIDGRVDVYAMGVILYEAIAGHRPFEADSLSALAVRIATTEPIPLTELRPDLPPGLCDVVTKAMARDRDQRYASMEEFVAALSPFIPDASEYSVPPDQAVPLRTPRSSQLPRPQPPALTTNTAVPPLRSGWRPWKWLAAAVALAGGLGLWLMWGAGDEATPEPAPSAAGAPGADEPKGPAATAPFDEAEQPDPAPRPVQPEPAAEQRAVDAGGELSAEATQDAVTRKPEAPGVRPRKKKVSRPRRHDRGERRARPVEPRPKAAADREPERAPQAEAPEPAPAKPTGPEPAKPKSAPEPDEPAPQKARGRAGSLEIDEF